MSRILIVFSWLFTCSSLYGQNIWNKKSIDTTAIENWVSLGSITALTNDGNYFAYSIYGQPTKASTLILQTTKSSAKISIPKASFICFTQDSKMMIFKTGDTLMSLIIQTKTISSLGSFKSFKQPDKDKGLWLAYHMKAKENVVILRNLLTGKEELLTGVLDYFFDNNGQVLIIKQNNGLVWKDLKSGNSKIIWLGDISKLNGFVFDRKSKQLAFVETGNGGASNKIWFCSKDLEKAIPLLDNLLLGTQKNFFLSAELPAFSEEGKYLFFTLQIAKHISPVQSSVNINVWSSNDSVLQATQIHEISKPEYVKAVVNLEEVFNRPQVSNIDMIVLENSPYESLSTWPVSGDYVVVTRNSKDDRFWLTEPNQSWLVSLKDGSRVLLPPRNKDAARSFMISPGGNYLLYYDSEKGSNYFSYNLHTGKIANISSGVPSRWLAEKDQFWKRDSFLLVGPLGIGGWVEDEKAVLVYDHYDIWKLDLSGELGPVNITNGYGHSQKIKFRLLQNGDRLEEFSVAKPLVVNAYDFKEKLDGFYLSYPNNESNPLLLSMGPWTTFHHHKSMPSSAQEFESGMTPVKAGSKKLWIVKRCTVTDAPNYFSTTDFKNYNRLTDVQPQNDFNWITADKINFKQLDGSFSQGILYKPENFDPKKKYPLIIHYYEQLSHRLFEYPKPEYLSTATINIPLFVSNGYLIFTPDIYYETGKIGPSAYNAVVGATKYLMQQQYIDSERIAINGHSRGGMQTNYLISHTKLFAAAFEGAGTTDDLSAALQLGGIEGERVYSRLEYHELRMGANPWENPEIYLDNSVLKAEQIVTPLLMFHCKKDGAVPWHQAIELYIALRRLGKLAWLLEYENGGHGLHLRKDAKDLTIRALHFFNHYLQDKPAPVWMTKGIRASMKGIETGYELDPAGNCGRDCKVCKMWNEKYKRDPLATIQEVKRFEGQ